MRQHVAIPSVSSHFPTTPKFFEMMSHHTSELSYSFLSDMLSSDRAMSSLHSGTSSIISTSNKLFLVLFDLCVATAVRLYREQRIGTHGIRSSAQVHRLTSHFCLVNPYLSIDGL